VLGGFDARRAGADRDRVPSRARRRRPARPFVRRGLGSALGQAVAQVHSTREGERRAAPAAVPVGPGPHPAVEPRRTPIFVLDKCSGYCYASVQDFAGGCFLSVAVAVKPIDWKNAHEQLVRLAGSRAALDHEEGRWLLAALRSAAHVRLGYATFAEYVERLFGYAPRWTAEKLRVAEAVEELPQMDQALRDGALNWSALRELTRVATRNTEGEWIEASKGRSARQIEQLVAGHRPGDRPDDPACPLTRKHVLRLELSADAMAAYKEAIAKLQRDAGGRLDEEEALLQMARQVLGGPTDQGRASYQIALTVCDRCGRGWQQGRGELMEVGP